jgi:predicted amidohydrolase
MTRAISNEQIVIGLAQMTSVDSIQENIRQITDLVESIDEHCELIVFPENCLFFRTDRSQKLPKITLTGTEISLLQELSKKTRKTLLLGGVPTESVVSTNKVSNSIIKIAPTEKPQILYSKMHLFDVDVPGAPSVRESEVFEAGTQPHVYEFLGFKIGLSICYDVRFSSLYEYYARKSVDAIVVPSAFLVPTGQAHWHVLLKARAIESQCYIIAPAQSGEHIGSAGSRTTFGHSLVVGPWGEILMDLQNSKPKVELITLKRNEIEKVRMQIPMHLHRKDITFN